MTDILLIGRNGQLGFEFERLLAPRFEVLALDSRALDLVDPEAARAAVIDNAPALVINTAAYTAVDRAESDVEAAYAINATAPEVLARAASETGAGLLHFSTDFVFDGRKDTPYTEGDSTSPLNVYGQSKLAGEAGVLGASAAAMVFRTSWLYATRGNNFLLTMRRLLTERDSLNVVDDQVGSPTWVRELARLVVDVMPKDATDLAGFVAANAGLYHLSCEGTVSWHGFAAKIREHLLASGRKVAELNAIPSSGYPTPATRPHYSVLSKAKFRERFGVVPADWDTALDAAFTELPA